MNGSFPSLPLAGRPVAGSAVVSAGPPLQQQLTSPPVTSSKVRNCTSNITSNIKNNDNNNSSSCCISSNIGSSLVDPELNSKVLFSNSR